MEPFQIDLMFYSLGVKQEGRRIVCSFELSALKGLSKLLTTKSRALDQMEGDHRDQGNDCDNNSCYR